MKTVQCKTNTLSPLEDLEENQPARPKLLPLGPTVKEEADPRGSRGKIFRRDDKGRMCSTHGLTAGGKTKQYSVWQQMHVRCYDTKNWKYPRYGGRGIKVCNRWHNYANFLADMGPKPEGLSIDRIDNDGDYCPENCRWATLSEQMMNRSNARLLTFNGRTQNAIAWAREIGISVGVIYHRLDKAKWPIERALTQPLRSQKT